MDNLKIINNILNEFESAMDDEKFDTKLISPEALGISATKQRRLLLMLVKEGYIRGIYNITNTVGGKVFFAANLEITLKGLEYHAKNSMQ